MTVCMLEKPMQKADKFVAQRVLDVVECGLTSGVGIQKPGKMCVEAAVAFAMGLPHGDQPLKCVAGEVINAKIDLNDSFHGKVIGSVPPAFERSPFSNLAATRLTARSLGRGMRSFYGG
jgi:hypothetical protein